MLFKPILEVAEKYNIFQSAVAASENLYDIINEIEEESGTFKLQKPRGTLEFKNVWFSYDKKEWVLKDVSFKISPGETVALVGLTGSGKTTIVNLILKFYEPQKGEILFNGININDLDNSSLRENITAVFQDLFLFGKEISEDRIATLNLSEKFGLELKEDTHRLSAGENQVISIAKAITKKSSLLILDEATSHIDAVIEKNIQESIRKSNTDQSKLIIAHRLSNVRDVDKLLVIHEGEIIEEGTHNELIKNGGIYQTLNKLYDDLNRIPLTSV